jgi:MoxR-like ATPases
MSSKVEIDSLSLKPSQVLGVVRAVIPTGRAAYIWGPPGIAKSSIMNRLATENNVAFIDIRVSQMEPSDLRGIPYPTMEGGREGVRWSVPIVLPQDLDITLVREIEAIETKISFCNPKGSNNIHYCTRPKVAVRSLTPGAEAVVVQQYQTNDDGDVLYYDEDGNVSTDPSKGEPVPVAPLDYVVVKLVDRETKEPVQGKVHVVVTGRAKGIIALEEFNSAPQSVQAAAYQFVLDRRLGEYVVPDGVSIIAMGNRETDKGVTYRLPTPLANRFVHIEMRHDFDEWLMWAIDSEVHPDVVAYLTAHKDHLFSFDPNSASRGFATPRSWEMVSDILHHAEDLSETELTAAVAGCVGEGIAVEFVEMRKIGKRLPDIGDILDGKVTKLDDKDKNVSVEYRLALMLAYELNYRVRDIVKKKNFEDTEEYAKWVVNFENAIGFLSDNLRPEIMVMIIRVMVANYKFPIKLAKVPKFKEIAMKYKGILS